MKKILTLIGLIAAVSHVGATELTPATPECIIEAAQKYNFDPLVLLAILYVEGGTVGQVTKNTNGTYDIGLFQINSIHLPELAKRGITETQLKNDGCINTAEAAYHLRRVIPYQKLDSINTHDDFYRMIARYHSVTPEHNQRYAGRLKNAFNQLSRY